jgi:hypothetical protein
MKSWMIPLAVLIPMLVAGPVVAGSDLGDMTSFEKIASETLLLVDRGDLKAAEKRITDFETAWDEAEHALYPKDKDAWSAVDDSADAAISSLRAGHPDQVAAQKAVSALIDTLRDPAAH